MSSDEFLGTKGRIKLVKLSIVIPAYNVEELIVRCLSSLLPLSESNVEIIVVDDGSTDNTKKIIRNFFSTNQRLKFLLIEKENGGLSSARNAGMAKATGDYILFLDSDDYINAYNLIKLIPILEKGYDVVLSSPEIKYESFEYLKSSDERYFKLTYSGLKESKEIDLFQIPVVAWSKIFNLESIRTWNIKFPEGLLYEDNYFFWVFMKSAESFYFSEIPFYIYVRREGSIMANTFLRKPGYAIQRIFVLRKIFEDCGYLLDSEKRRLAKDFYAASVTDCPLCDMESLKLTTNKLLCDFNLMDLSKEFFDKSIEKKISSSYQFEKILISIKHILKRFLAN